MFQTETDHQEYRGIMLKENGGYKAIAIYQGCVKRLELRISLGAIVQSLGHLDDQEVCLWLWERGLEILKEASHIKENLGVAYITAHDIENSQIITNWNRLILE